MQEAIRNVYKRIPHRPPFLWVDKILSLQNNCIETEKYIPADLEIFKGHYPQYPLMPGVLLCEAVFQSGALLISGSAKPTEKHGSLSVEKVPVITRIYSAKFKNKVLPGSTLHMLVSIQDSLESVWIMKGKALVDEKVALLVTFGCMLVDRE
jgi:3-hydroxyacyl-[acyl-carrier-protein] dehydratase